MLGLNRLMKDGARSVCPAHWPAAVRRTLERSNASSFWSRFMVLLRGAGHWGLGLDWLEVESEADKGDAECAVGMRNEETRTKMRDSIRQFLKCC